MERKFILFVVFAAVAQCFFVGSLAASDNPSGTLAAGLRELTVIQDVALGRTYEAFNQIFDIITIRLASLITNTSEPVNRFGQPFIAFDRIKEAADNVLNAIPFALGTTACDDAVDAAAVASQSSVDEAFRLIVKAFAAAQFSDESDNAREVEKYRAPVQDRFALVIANIYSPLFVCLNSMSRFEVLATVQAAQDDSVRAIINLANSLFNALRVYGNAVVRGTADIDDLLESENFRISAKLALETDIVDKFSLLKALYLYLAQTGNVEFSDLYQLARADTISGYKFQKVTEIIFSTISNISENVDFGFGAVEPDDFTMMDIQEARTVAKFRAGTHQILLAVVPKNLRAVNAADVKSSAWISHLMSLVFDQIETASNTVPHGPVPDIEIQNIKVEIYSVIAEYLAGILDLYVNQFEMTTQTKADLTATILTAAKDQFELAAGYITDANTLLANAASDGKTVDLIASVSDLENVAVSAMRELSQILSYSKLILLTQ